MSQELKRRKDAYKNVEEKFGFLTKTKSMDIEQIRAATEKLKKIYPQDLEEDFTAEFCQFISMVKDEESVMAMYKKLLELGLRDAFPNVDICLRMYLTLPIANCSGERSFSALKRVKTYRRATVTEKKLNAFALMAIENTFTTSLDFDDIIEDFASSKLRRKHL